MRVPQLPADPSWEQTEMGFLLFPELLEHRTREDLFLRLKDYWEMQRPMDLKAAVSLGGKASIPSGSGGEVGWGDWGSSWDGL